MSSTAGYLFDRSWALTLSNSQTAFKYTGLRITFDIEKTSTPEPNKAKISIYNLAPSSRQNFQKGSTVRVDAGYQNLIETLWIGDAVKVYSKRNQTEIETTFECGDSERELVLANFDKSYPAGTTNIQVMQDVAKALNISVGTVVGLQKVVYNHGVSFTGSAKRTLDQLTKTTGLEFSVQNGILQIVPKTAHLGQEAIVLSTNTGLIGIPSQGDGFIQFNALLNPKIHPGTLVQIVSETQFLNTANLPTLNGFFKVRKAKYEGDSHGDKWNVECEATPINATQNLPMNQGFNFSTAVVA